MGEYGESPQREPSPPPQRFFADEHFVGIAGMTESGSFTKYGTVPVGCDNFFLANKALLIYETMIAVIIMLSGRGK